MQKAAVSIYGGENYAKNFLRQLLKIQLSDYTVCPSTAPCKITRRVDGSRLLEAPFYQRADVWDDEQWDRFLADMEFVMRSIWSKHEKRGIETKTLTIRLISAKIFKPQGG